MSNYDVLSWKKRMKSGNNSTTMVCKHYCSTDGGPPSQIWTSGTVPRTKDEWLLNGWDIPNFHQRLRKGELMPLTPFSVSRLTHKIERSAYSFGRVAGGHTYVYSSTDPHVSGRYVSNCFVSAADAAAHIPATYDDYVAEAAAKVYNQGHDTFTFLAELASVRTMFCAIFKSMLKLNVPGKYGLFKKMDSKWLSYRYGWRTLVYDIASLNEAIIGLSGGMQRHHKYAGKDSVSTDTTAWDVTDTVGTVHCVYNDKVTIGIRGTVVADVSIPMFQFNPLQTGWELIPYSFVLDWLLNVGRTLAAFSFLSLRPDYVAAKGYKVTVTRTYSEYMDSWINGHYPISGHYMQTTSTAEVTVRTPCRIPIHPHFNVKLDPSKILDLMGLFFQRIH